MRMTVLARLLQILLLAVLSGCAGTARDDSVGLAKAGASLAGAAQSNLAQIRSSLDDYVEGQFLRANLKPGQPEPSKEEIASIRKIQRAIVLRERALTDLATVYLSFQNLGEYDVAGEVATRMNALTESVNEFGTTLGSNSPLLTNVSAGFLAKGAGMLAGAAQADVLRKASPEIRIRLERFRDHLKRQQQSYDAMRDIIAQGRTKTAEALFESGIGDPAPVFRDVIASYGLDYSESEAAAKLAALGAPGRKAMGQVITYRAESAAYFEASILDQTLSGMNALIAQHQQLETGESLSLTAVQRELSLIQGLVDDYVRWRQLDALETKKRREAAATTRPG